MSLDLHVLAAKIESWAGYVPVELQADAAKVAVDVKAEAVRAADAEITKVAPGLAPELILLLPEAFDYLLGAAQSRIALLTAAKQAIEAPAA